MTIINNQMRPIFLFVFFIIFSQSCLAQNDEWEKALEELKLSKYYVDNKEFASATIHIESSVEIIKQKMMYLSQYYSYKEKYMMWQQMSKIFHDIYPSVISLSPTKNSIEELYNTILFSKNFMIPGCKDMSTSYDWKLIEKRLTGNDVAIEFLDVDNFFISDTTNTIIYALIIRKGQSPKMLKLFDYYEFVDAFTNRRNTARKVLGEMIWTPIIKDIGNINNIYFSPTNIFEQIPIEYLPVDEWKSISDKYNLYRLSSTNMLTLNPPKRIYKKAVLYGGLNYEGMENYGRNHNTNIRSGFDYLNNTKEEIDTICGIMQEKDIKFKAFTGTKGTETSLKEISKQEFDILHIATHGMYVKSEQADSIAKLLNINFLHPNSNDNTIDEDSVLMRSFLVMAGGNRLIYRQSTTHDENDGLLTAAEIALLELSDVDIVTLSACDSGIGEWNTDGIIGLQRAFKRAGVKTILMSFSKVDDEATKILMIEFYKNLMEGKSKYQSFKNAQKYLREVDNGKYEAPEYWEPFVMLDGLN